MQLQEHLPVMMETYDWLMVVQPQKVGLRSASTVTGALSAMTSGEWRRPGLCAGSRGSVPMVRTYIIMMVSNKIRALVEY